MDDRDARERVGRVEALLEQVESGADAGCRETALGLAQALLELYGEGLSRMVDVVAAADRDGALARAFADDELVAHLLLVHGLHPLSVQQRVLEALAEVEPYLTSHGGGVELVGVRDATVSLRLQGSCSGCPSSSATLALAVEDAIRKHAPEIEHVEAEGVPAPAQAAPLLSIEVIAPAAEAGWSMAGGMPELRGGGRIVKDVAGERVLFIGMDEHYYAYRPECPACRSDLAEGSVAGARIACPECGNRYEVRGAGRCVGDPALHLRPVPLLVDEAGMVRVAVGTAA